MLHQKTNPYKKQPNKKVNQAISKIKNLSQDVHSQHTTASLPSVQSDDISPVILRTSNRHTRHLRRAIRVKERLTIKHNNLLSQNSSAKTQSSCTFTSSTDISPQAHSRSDSSAAKSARRRNEILKTFQEISNLTTEL